MDLHAAGEFKIADFAVNPVYDLRRTGVRRKASAVHAHSTGGGGLTALEGVGWQLRIRSAECPPMEVPVSCKPRYLSLPQLQRDLSLTRAQVMALIEAGDLPAFKIFGEWRVEQEMLGNFIDRLYELAPVRSEDWAEPQPGRVGDRSELSSTVDGSPALHTLTPQQQRVGRLLADGLSNAEIAKRLDLEVSTVKTHISRMLQRLDLRDRHQLIAHLWRSGALSGPIVGLRGRPGDDW